MLGVTLSYFSLLATTPPGDEGGVRSTVDSIADTHDQILLAMVAVIATSIGALVWVIRNGRYSKTAAEEATMANHAVNNVSEPDQRIWDKVDRIECNIDKLIAIQEQFASHGWDTLPPDLSNAVNLTQTIREMQHIDRSLHAKLDVIIEELRDHVDWEMKAKYGTHGNALTPQMDDH